LTLMDLLQYYWYLQYNKTNCRSYLLVSAPKISLYWMCYCLKILTLKMPFVLAGKADMYVWVWVEPFPLQS
jgi:hypothetical protein